MPTIPVSAQTATPAHAQGAVHQTAVPAVQPGQGQVLSDILDKLDWDPATRGSLLIVSPEEIEHNASQKAQMPDDDQKAKQKPPEPETGGRFRLSRLEDYYHPRLVKLPTVSVFAPATMSVLNTTHLPKVDPYANITTGEKVRLLESTFTPDQWRQIATPEGIGVGDLKNQQRDLFLSMLPNPFIVSAPGTPVVDSAGVSRPSPSVDTTLTEDQRTSIRFSLARKLTWSFKTGTNSRYTMDADQYASQSLRLKTPIASTEPANEVFGVALVSDIPSHLKTSQLPADWALLEKPVNLAAAATIADLVQQLAKQTGAELYCDPRYRSRKLYLRGTSAKAGDLCRALAWGVTGTWRRLGDAFVLTDDVVGLGVRHALIDTWVRQNALVAQIGIKQADDVLAKSHSGDYILWAPNDPQKPNDALKSKIDAFQNAPGTYMYEPMLVPTTELPLSVQDVIAGQIAQQERRKEVSPNLPTIEPGVVFLNVDVQPTYTIPGVGSVTAGDLRLTGFQQSLVTARHPKLPVLSDSANNRSILPPPFAFPSTLANRVVVVAPKIGDDIARFAREARRAGFSQLWVKADRGQVDLVESAIKAGSASGLLVQAIVLLARPAPSGKPDLLERNILGETLTDYVKRWRSQLQNLRIAQIDGPDTQRGSDRGQEPTEAWRINVLVDRILRGGDFLRCADPDAVRLVASDVARTASIAGLTGIVFSDVAAPGFNPVFAPGINFGVSDGTPEEDPLLTMGYADSARLVCLRKFGFDPIDLSPLNSGDQINLPFALRHSWQLPSIGLPFFRDLGPTGADTSGFGNSQPTTEAKDAADHWAALRKEQDAAFVATVVDSARTKAPSIQIMLRHTYNPLNVEMAYYGSVDTPVHPAPTADAAAPQKTGQAVRSPDVVREAARAAARTAYQSVRYNEAFGVDEAKRRFVNSLPNLLQGAANWDGIVIDFTDVPAARALELLAVFPDGTAPSPKAN